MPKIDVIIPYFNTPVEFARAAIASVLGQTFTDLRCVVVNDGSDPRFTVQLEELLARFRDARITYVKTSNGGAGAARNAGIRATNSPYIALLDSDDMWYPDRLALQIPVLDNNPAVALIHSGHRVLNANGTLMPAPAKDWLNTLSQREQLVAMLRENIVSVGTTLFRRSCAEAVGLFDEVFRNIEDKDFFLRLLVAGYEFFYLNDVVTIYRQHASNKSSNVDRMIAARLRLIEKMDKTIPARHDVRTMWPGIRRQMLRHVSQEAAEKCLERGDYWSALRHALMPLGGHSWATGKLAFTAAYGLVCAGRH
jgi:glycosyltransferase involved in cell wall biosynthesis